MLSVKVSFCSFPLKSLIYLFIMGFDVFALFLNPFYLSAISSFLPLVDFQSFLYCTKNTKLLNYVKSWRFGNFRCSVSCLKSSIVEIEKAVYYHAENFMMRDHIKVIDESKIMSSSQNSKDILYVMHLGPKSGWGLFTNKIILPNQNVLIYYGEYIDTKDTIQRQILYDKQKVNYVLTIKEQPRKEMCLGDLPQSGGGTDNTFSTVNHELKQEPVYKTVVLRTNVDATHYGGIARFVNHSCDPNMEVFIHREPGELFGVPVLRSLRTIYPGEQLSFDYGSSEIEAAPSTTSEEYLDENGRESTANKRQRVDSGEPIGRSLCHCGAANCRKYLPSVDTVQ